MAELTHLFMDMENAVICDICNAQFTSKPSTNGHITIIHEGRKQFKCEICNANFGQKGNLNIHVRTVHEKRKPFKSDFCNAQFTSNLA